MQLTASKSGQLDRLLEKFSHNKFHSSFLTQTRAFSPIDQMPGRINLNLLLPILLFAILLSLRVLVFNYESSQQSVADLACAANQRFQQAAISGTSGFIFAAHRVRHFPREQRIDFPGLLDRRSSVRQTLLP